MILKGITQAFPSVVLKHRNSMIVQSFIFDHNFTANQIKLTQFIVYYCIMLYTFILCINHHHHHQQDYGYQEDSLTLIYSGKITLNAKLEIFTAVGIRVQNSRLVRLFLTLLFVPITFHTAVMVAHMSVDLHEHQTHHTSNFIQLRKQKQKPPDNTCDSKKATSVSGHC